MQRKSLAQRIGGVLAATAGISLLASTGTVIAGTVQELRTPAAEQVASWVYRSREIARPAMYISLVPFALGSVLYYASKKLKE